MQQNFVVAVQQIFVGMPSSRLYSSRYILTFSWVRLTLNTNKVLQLYIGSQGTYIQLDQKHVESQRVV